ncbi:MAG: glutamine synthetase III [Spirochaetaceae bacterium]|nr:glutamine synthetase III [Spirochaetaceae bacterium]
MEKVTDYFGERVFGDNAMRDSLPKDVYRTLKNTIREGKDLDIDIANSVAHAMKEWALSKGATHYTHWFQPLTGITAEKHDSFISPTKDGNVILTFSGKELIKGEPDASSFPSGGIRSTFEARGYTGWDPTSYAFVKDSTLCIPTVFVSYGGEVLDKKTPLLRSMEAISKQTKRILALFGKDSKYIDITVGPEQEYFLIDRNLFNKRKDLIYTGRTLIGARAPKGQELDDHYFGNLRPRVSAFMTDLDKELWKYGVYAKTKHNEVAPAQHELATVFTTANISSDHNHIVMEFMKKVAEKHGLVCLLHEKPFAGVNGSGKHNNWSISTDEGVNLLEPGLNPRDNKQFLLVMVAIIKAIDDYQDLLRATVASAGNDHRLGANEAPPAIVSMFLGTQISSLLEDIAEGRGTLEIEGEKLRFGVHVLPSLIKDSTDRNRTSPFAFTGNKFEFRMLGSNESLSSTNTAINTAIAKSFKEFADELEVCTEKAFDKCLEDLIKREYLAHRRIVFNGNNYSDEWLVEAKKRGLYHLHSSVDAFKVFSDKKNVELFQQFKIFKESELVSRVEILYDIYAKKINIEALTLIDMLNEQIYPACNNYLFKLAEGAEKLQKVSKVAFTKTQARIDEIATLNDELLGSIEALGAELSNAMDIEDSQEKSIYLLNKVLPLMDECRIISDKLELIVDSEYWPIPTYGELLYSV